MSKKVTYQKKPHQEPKKYALSRNLNKSLEKYLIKNLPKILYKKPYQESKTGALSRNLIYNLKATNKASLWVC